VAGSPARPGLETKLATARALGVDQVTGEVVSALRAAGVPSIVLKGPAIHEALYADGGLRPYSDSDVLVPAKHIDRAREVAEKLGFEKWLAGDDVPSGLYVHATDYERPGDGARLDLHWTVPEAEAPPERVWQAFAADARPLTVGGVETLVPGQAALALHTALHAARHAVLHGRSLTKPARDLQRALDHVSREDWQRALDLAEGLDALESLSAGLRVLPDGARLAAELGLPEPRSVRHLIGQGDAPRTALGLDALATQQGLRPRLRMLGRALVPPRAYMPVWFPRAGRGAAWMAAGYLWRPLWLAGRAVPSVLAWRRARQTVRSAERPG